MAAEGLDPRWEWIKVTEFGAPGPHYIKGPCNHLETEPVESCGVTVAHLCLTCDQQLTEASW